jgi:universal stress protein A
VEGGDVTHDERGMKAKQQATLSASKSAGRVESRSAEPTRVRLRRILVPLDFSGKSRQALEFAVPLAEQYGGKIILIHVVEPMPAYPPFPGEVGVAAVNAGPVAEASQKRLAGLARELVPAELLAETTVRHGRAYREIIDAADELGVDLIVIATHGYTGLKHVLLGSTAEHVVRHARCAVLTVRQRAPTPEGKHGN